MITLREAVRRSRIVSDDSGVTLIELMVASAILFIAAIGVIAALTFSASASAQSAQRSAALNLANQRLELSRDIPYDNVGVYYADGSYGDPPGTIAAEEQVGDYYVVTTVDWSRDATSGRAEYKNIKITISWERPRPGTVSLASAIYGTSALTNNGDLKVIVKERSTGNVIHMAQVTITPNGTATPRVKWTNASGEAFYGMLPIGVVVLARVDASGWVFEPITLPTVQPDLVTNLYVYAHRPCSAVVHVVDTSGTPIPNAYVRLADSRATYHYLYTGDDGIASFAGLYPDTYAVRVTEPSRATATGVLGPMVDGGSYATTITMTAPVPPGSLRIRIKDTAGTALQSASVAVVGPSPDTTPVAGSPQITGSAGEVVFSTLVSGTYTITSTRTGYLPTTVSATVVSGVEQIVTINMPSAAALTGNLTIEVKTTSGNPNTDQGVDWWSGSSTDGTALGHQHTDSNGRVILTGLTPGTYTVRTRTGDHTYDTRTVTVFGGSTTVVTLTSDR